MTCYTISIFNFPSVAVTLTQIVSEKTHTQASCVPDWCDMWHSAKLKKETQQNLHANVLHKTINVQTHNLHRHT